MGRNEGSVARRRVIYIPGYDPFPPRRYRELYRTEGARQAALANYAREVLPRREAQGFGWALVRSIDDALGVLADHGFTTRIAPAPRRPAP